LFIEWIIKNLGRANALEISLEDANLVKGVFNKIIEEVSKDYREEMTSNDNHTDLDGEYLTIYHQISM